MIRHIFALITLLTFFTLAAFSQTRPPMPKHLPKVLYGTASFYANKFEGRLTANGEIFSQKKLTAACNVLPLGTWIRVTNLRNGRSVVVKVNDRLHYRMKRVADLSGAAAHQIGHNDGLVRVKVEVIERKKVKA